MAKFKAGDIVVGTKDHLWTRPVVILGEYTFANGIAAYRLRDCLPQVDDDGTEFWLKDGYMEQSFIDQFELLWREGK